MLCKEHRYNSLPSTLFFSTLVDFFVVIIKDFHSINGKNASTRSINNMLWVKDILFSTKNHDIHNFFVPQHTILKREVMGIFY